MCTEYCARRHFLKPRSTECCARQHFLERPSTKCCARQHFLKPKSRECCARCVDGLSQTERTNLGQPTVRLELSLLPSYWWATHNFARFVTTSPSVRRHTGSHENLRLLVTISLRAARFHSTVSLQPYPELILGSHVFAMYFLL